MDIEQIITILIYVHAFFGGLGLITGIISIAVKKGGSVHKKTGKVFSFAMVISAVLSLIIARMPHHENLFLFLIGIFTIYLVLSGNRALSFKKKSKKAVDWKDNSISGSMLLVSIIMLGIGIAGLFQQINNSILYLFFSVFGILVTITDFKTYKSLPLKKNEYLKLHVGRMVGALIASVTAFLVAGLSIKSAIVWFLPTLIGTAYIIYWGRKLQPKTDAQK
jgi:uncharacterized membrane protein